MSKLRQSEFEWQIEEFMVYCKSKDLRKKTMLSYEQSLCLFQKWCKDRLNICTVEEITESVVRRYITELQERGKYTYYANDKTKVYNVPEHRRDFNKPVSAVTINNYLRNIRVFFSWLVEQEILTKNPMKKIKALRTQRTAREFMSDEDFNKLASNLDKTYFSEHRDYAMIVLLLDTGMRLGECSRLLVEEVDFSRNRIYLKAENTKGRKDRVVYFSDKTEAILRKWLRFKDRYMETIYLFPSRTTKAALPVAAFETNFKKYLLRFGINNQLSPHCLRNNFAKRCLMNGMDVYTLSKILGHSSVTITEKAYLDLNEDDIALRYKNHSPIDNMKRY